MKRLDRKAVGRLGSLIAHEEPLVGFVVQDRYEIQRHIARGGMGTVFLAWDHRVQRAVAMKILATEITSSEVETRFQTEARTMSRIDHPGIVPVHDMGVLPDGRLFYTMKFIEGDTLSARIEQRADRASLVRCLAEVCDIVQHAHERQVIHRDLKPLNVMIDGSGRSYVLDWGVARVVRDFGAGAAESAGGIGTTRLGSVLGTIAYMAPEQAAGHNAAVDERSDVFGLGAILYEILTGGPPVTGSTVREALENARNGRYVAPRTVSPDVPRDLEAVCLKAMAMSPSDRYASARELGLALRRHLGGGRAPARWRAVLLPASICALLVAAFGVWAIRGQVRRTRRSAEAVASAKSLLGERKYGESRSQLRVALDLDPSNEEAAGLLAEIDRRVAMEREEAKALAKRVEEARQTFQTSSGILRSWENSRPPYSEIASRLESMISEIEAALASMPENALGHFTLGLCLHLRGDEDRAEKEWRRTIELDPDFGPARYRLGRRSLLRAIQLQENAIDEGRPVRTEESERLAAEAATLLRQAASLGTGSEVEPALRELVAVFLDYTRGRPAAERRAEEATRKFAGRPGVEEIHWFLGVIRGEEGLESLHAALKIRPHFPDALLARSHVRRHRGEFEAALADARAAIAGRPRHAPAYYESGRSRRDLGRTDEAAEDFRAAIRLDPSHAPAHAWLGEIELNVQGNPGGSIGHLTRAIQLRPDLEFARTTRGCAHLDLQDYSAARDDFREALKLSPKSPEARVGHGMALMGLGRDEEALPDLTLAVELKPGFADAWFFRGQIHERAGRKAAAAADYRMALQVCPPKWPLRGPAERRLREVTR